MGIYVKRLRIYFIFLLINITTVELLIGSEEDINLARQEFLLGNYVKSIDIASKLETIDSKIFQARAISIYSFFFKEAEDAKLNYLNAYEIAKISIARDPNNDEAYVEAAHALGRYGQEIGIMAAISKGIADKVKNYIDKALSLNPNNILANLSKGIWHAEVINQAGKTLAKAIYGADIKMARTHFVHVYNLNNDEIGILYELAYGYYLLGTDKDIDLSLNLIKTLTLKKEKAHLDQLYKKIAIDLKRKIDLKN